MNECQDAATTAAGIVGNPKASRRALATKGHELGLQVLDRVTAETHRRQVAASAKQDSR